MPYATQWYLSEVYVSDSGIPNDLYGLYDAVWACFFYQQCIQGIYILFMTCNWLIRLEKECIDILSQVATVVCILSLTISLFVLAYFRNNHFGATIAFIIAGLGNLVQFPTPSVFSAMMSWDKSTRRRAEVDQYFHMGQMVAFLFLPFIIHHWGYLIQFLMSGVFGALALFTFFFYRIDCTHSECCKRRPKFVYQEVTQKSASPSFASTKSRALLKKKKFSESKNDHDRTNI
jgi:MFS family permease